MLGPRQTMQESLFYGFSLEQHVPECHLLRRIDALVDLSEVRTHLAPYCSDTVRPSIDPELMIRMLIVGYCFAIRSERRREPHQRRRQQISGRDRRGGLAAV
jgi:transposase